MNSGFPADSCPRFALVSKIKNKNFAPHRLSPDPHYFGVGVIGDSITDPDSEKGDLFCEILHYQEFDEAIPNKVDNEYLEEIPESRKSNYCHKKTST